MLLRISDKVTDICDKSIVLGVSIHCHYIVKILILNLSETQKRYMLACVPSLAITEKWSLSGRRRRVILSVVSPIEQVSNRPMIVILVERSLIVTQELWFVCTEITSRYHR